MPTLHVFREQRFADAAIEKFERVSPGNGHYVILARTGFSFGVPTLTPRIQQKSHKELIKEINHGRFNAIVFHSIGERAKRLILDIDECVPIAWIGWGFDYYSRLLKSKFNYPLGLLEPRTTKAYLSGREGAFYRYQRIVESLRRVVSPQRLPPEKPWIDKVNIFSPVLRSEFHLIKKENPWLAAEFRQWGYGGVPSEPVAQYLKIAKSNILIGNSATWTNNHLDVFEQVALRNERTFERVIVPLAYGNPRVRSLVIDRGKYYFGKKFSPILTELARRDYWELLSTVHTFYFHNIRQQAMGSVNMAIMCGGNLVLNGRGLLYDELISRGVACSTLDNPKCATFDEKLALKNIKSQELFLLNTRSDRHTEELLSSLVY